MEAIHDRYLTGSNVGNHLGDEEGVELRTVLTMGSIVGYLVLESLDTADTYAVDHTNAVFVFGLQVHGAVLNSLLGSNQGQLGIAVHLASLLAVQVCVDVKVLDLTGKLRLEVGGIEMGNRSCTALACQHVLPSLLGSIA